MTEETYKKAEELQGTIYHWRKQIDELRAVISNPQYYHFGFASEHKNGSISTEMNNMLIVPFAKQCLEFAENRLQDALKEFSKL